MGSTNTQDGKMKYKVMIVGARNLVAAVMKSAKKAFGEAGEKLFGISNPFQTTFQGEATIADGNTAQFLKDRIDQFDVNGIKLPAAITSLNEAIVDIAKQLVKQFGTTTGLNEQQLTRIAVEYVTQACCIGTSAIEPFGSYLGRAKAYRTAMKALNKTEKAANPEAFSGGSDLGQVEKTLEQGRAAWANANRYLAESVHLAALRTRIDAPILFTGMEAWQAVNAVNADVRLAVLNDLRTTMEQRGNPYVTTATVQQAIARVAGNQLLTGGNAFGVEIGTAIEAMASSRAHGVQPNGGTQVGFEGTPAFVLGDALRGMHAHVSGVAKQKDGRTIGYELDVTEGSSPTAPFTAPIAIVAARAAAQQQHAY